MKKALAMGLGALLAAGSAAPAFAASQIDFSGYYRMYFSNLWNNNYSSSDARTSDSAFSNRLQMDFGFHATDEISVFWRLRAPSAQRWGTNDLPVITQWIYGRIQQDWGTVTIGRLPNSSLFNGLSNLGWQPKGADGSGDYTLVNPFDFLDDPADGIRYANRWDNGFQIVAQFNRLSTRQSSEWNGASWVAGDEEFADLFVLEPAYFWDGGGATLGLNFLRDRARTSTYGNDDPVDKRGTYADRPALKAFYINPAVSHRWDNGFAIHFEGKAGWGTDDNVASGQNGRKLDGYAFYLDFDYNYGPGNLNLAGWWASGDDGGEKRNDLVGMGAEFKPLLIAYGSNISPRVRTDGGNAVARANDRSGAAGNKGAFGGGVFGGNQDQSNHWVINLNGNHKFTDDISVTYALAYLALNKTKPGAKKDIGWEADLSFQFQLLDNLRFGTSFGYLFAGKALNDTTDGVVNVKASDTYGWFNTLTFSF